VTELSLWSVPADEQSRVYATLVSAFKNDPVERWLYPEVEQYLARFPDFLAAFGGQAFATECVWMLGNFDAVALWLPPGVSVDTEAIVNTLAGSVSLRQHEDLFLILEQMDAAHPKYPHWYLPWLGVAPGRQGQGIGSRLMQHCIDFVDETHRAAYLETPNPRTISFYERYGFEVTGQAEAGSCPPITFMTRPPQFSRRRADLNRPRLIGQ
jgi:ribosomal protein S18 acetylase RimI-like enzyme